MDHESMNLWDDPAVVKARAEAAIERLKGMTWREIFTSVKLKVLGAFKRPADPHRNTTIVLTWNFQGGFGALDGLRLESLDADRDKVSTKEG